MGKPSIFSKEYEKKMKKRKKRILVILLIVVSVSGAVTMVTSKSFSLTNIKQKIEATISNKKKDAALNDVSTQDSKTNKVQENKNPSQESKEASKENVAEENENKDNEEKYIEVTLSSGNVSRAIYDEESGNRKFKALTPVEEGTTFDISPDKKFLVINDNATQQIKFIDTNGNQKDITYLSYTTKNKEVIGKDTMLNDYPGYIWSKSAKFIDDTHVVYLSQLPYFGKGNLLTYAWIIDINTGVHTTLWDVKGSDIKFGNLIDKGLEVEIDGIKKVLTPSATLIQ